MASKEALGMSMTISEDFINNLTRELVSASLIEALDNKHHIAEELVRAVLYQKVDKRDGSLTTSTYNTTTFIRYQFEQMMKEETIQVAKELLEEKRPEIRALIRKEMAKKVNQDKIFDAFYSAILDNLESQWHTTINFEFKKRGE